MVAPSRTFALTRIGQKAERRMHFRRDANCPVITHVRRRGQGRRRQVPGWLVNISEEGCLITSDHFEPDLSDLYLVVPGFSTKLFGKVVNQGEFTVNMSFSEPITAEMVSKAARLTIVPGS